MSSVSVLITGYHPERLKHSERIANAWLKQPVEQVWYLDNSGGVGKQYVSGIKDKRFTYWPLPLDFQCKVDYGVASLTEGDWIIFADDDIVPTEGFVEDLLFWANKTAPSFVGTNGRKATAPIYRKCKWAGAKHVTQPVEVDVVGVIYMAHRDHCHFDVRGMHPVMDDFHHMLAYLDVKKYVVPTKAFVNLPTCSGPTAMYSSATRKQQRMEMFEKLYNKHWRTPDE